MNKKILKIITVVLMFCMLLNAYIAYPSTSGLVKKYSGDNSPLNDQELMAVESFVAAIQFAGDEGYLMFADEIRSGCYTKKTIEILMNEGFYVEYYEEFKNSGLISENYILPSKSKNNPIITPEPVTTEKCEEKVMWSKSDVNVRENGSTSYKKVGSLKKDEKVTVTGIDSTGWYEIRKEDGTVGHVSDKYLTEEAPSVSADVKENEKVPEADPVKESYIINIDGRTVTWYNAELGMEEIAVLDDKIPLDKVEEMANQYLIHGESYSPTPVAEPTEKPTPAPTIAPSKEPESTPTVSPTTPVSIEENSSKDINGQYIIIGVLVVAAVCIGLAIIYFHRKDKH